MKENNNYCTFYIVRHGETDWNKEGRYQGHSGVPLNETGRQQAGETREKLKHIHFDAIFSSDLLRAKETAEILAIERNLAVQTSALLRERNQGNLEGRYGKEVKKEFKKEFEKLEKLSTEEQWKHKRNQQYESNEELVSRVIRFLRETAVAYPGKTILITTHGGPIRTLLMHLGYAEKGTLGGGSFKNAGYIKVRSDGIDFFVDAVEGLEKVVDRKE